MLYFELLFCSWLRGLAARVYYYLFVKLITFRFWQEKVAFTPESRKAVHEHMKEVKKREEK